MAVDYPYWKNAAVTCSDSVLIATGPTRGLSVKTAGDYPVLMAKQSGTTAVTVNLAAGVIHRISVIRVDSTGAAATTGVVAWY